MEMKKEFSISEEEESFDSHSHIYVFSSGAGFEGTGRSTRPTCE